MFNKIIEEDSVNLSNVPDEIIIEILALAKTPKELLQWRRVSKRIERLVFAHTLWKKFLPKELKELEINSYSPEIYQFFARAYYSSFHQQFIKEYLINPMKFHELLCQWSEPGKEIFINEDETEGILPFLLGREEAYNYFNSLNALSDWQWGAVLTSCNDKKLINELLEKEWLFNNEMEDEEDDREIMLFDNYEGYEGPKLSQPASKELWKKAKLFNVSLINGKLEQMKELLKNVSLEQQTIILTSITRRCRSTICDAIYENNYYFHIKEWLFWDVFAKNPHVIKRIDSGWSHTFMAAAMKNGDLDTAKYFFEKLTITNGAQNGYHDEVLKEILMQTSGYYNDGKPSLFFQIIENGHLDVVTWLWEELFPQELRVYAIENIMMRGIKRTEEGIIEEDEQNDDPSYPSWLNIIFADAIEEEYLSVVAWILGQVPQDNQIKTNLIEKYFIEAIKFIKIMKSPEIFQWIKQNAAEAQCRKIVTNLFNQINDLFRVLDNHESESLLEWILDYASPEQKSIISEWQTQQNHKELSKWQNDTISPNIVVSNLREEITDAPPVTVFFQNPEVKQEKTLSFPSLNQNNNNIFNDAKYNPLYGMFQCFVEAKTKRKKFLQFNVNDFNDFRALYIQHRNNFVNLSPDEQILCMHAFEVLSNGLLTPEEQEIKDKIYSPEMNEGQKKALFKK